MVRGLLQSAPEVRRILGLFEKRTKCHACGKTGHWKGSPECKGATSISSLMCGDCGAPMMDTDVMQKAAYNDYWTWHTSWDDGWYPEDLSQTHPPQSGENDAQNDDDVDYSPQD